MRKNTSQTLKELIRAALENEGYTVTSFERDYLTRQKRLSVQKLVFFEQFEITRIRVQEGSCFDMKLTLRVIDNPEYGDGVLCEIWGRSVLEGDETRPWRDIFQDCVSNMANVPELRQALAPASSPATSVSFIPTEP